MERQLSEDLAVESQEEKDYKFEFFELLDEVSVKIFFRKELVSQSFICGTYNSTFPSFSYYDGNHGWSW